MTEHVAWVDETNMLSPALTRRGILGSLIVAGLLEVGCGPETQTPSDSEQADSSDTADTSNEGTDTTNEADASTETLPPWATELDLLVANPLAFYSFVFIGEPEDGIAVNVHLHSADDACDYYGPKGSEKDEFWTLQLQLGAPDLGDYELVQDLDHTLPRQERRNVLAKLVHVVNGAKFATYPAVSGVISVAGGPTTMADWAAGDEVHAQVDLEFPLDALHTAQCEGEASGPTTSNLKCECVDDMGVRSECEPERDGISCCLGTGPTHAVSFELSATTCPGMCAATSDSLRAEHCPL